MGVVHKPDPTWASFIPVLVRAMELSRVMDITTDGSVLELGMGYFSTPLLHALCEAEGRFLRSYESDGDYIRLFSRFRTGGHWIDLVDDWEKQNILINYGAYQGYSVAFVDQKPAEARKESIKKLTDVDYVVIHDSNDPTYDYDEIYPLFKYRYEHRMFNFTTVLSNKHDVKNLFHNTLG